MGQEGSEETVEAMKACLNLPDVGADAGCELVVAAVVVVAVDGGDGGGDDAVVDQEDVSSAPTRALAVNRFPWLLMMLLDLAMLEVSEVSLDRAIGRQQATEE